MKRRIASLLLALCMVLTLLPVTAVAAEVSADPAAEVAAEPETPAAPAEETPAEPEEETPTDPAPETPDDPAPETPDDPDSGTEPEDPADTGLATDDITDSAVETYAAASLAVAGTDVSAGGYWKTTADGGLTATGASASDYNVAYDAARQVLTLQNANLSQYSWINSSVVYENYPVGGGMYGCILTTSGIYIDLVGSNSIDLSGVSVEKGSCVGIYANGITFRGDGDITIQSGTGAKDSFGVCTYFSTVFEGTGNVSIFGGPCGATNMSAGVFISGDSDDLAAYVKAVRGNVVLGTRYGGTYSYGVRGKMEFPKYDVYTGSFTAYCGSADTAVALCAPPVYMPVGNTVLVADPEPAGTDLVAYRCENNGAFRYVTTKSALPGASVSGGLVENVDLRTPYSITVSEPTILGGNPGNQAIEYALTLTNSGDRPNSGWQTNPTFIGLAPNSSYKVWARTAATTEYAAGSPISTTSHPRTMTGGTIDGGLCVDGIGINVTNDRSEIQLDGGSAVYESETRTLTFTGNVSITHGCVVPQGHAVGIFSTGDLNIVLADGATLTIDLKNYERDDGLLKTHEKGYRISGNAVGILAAGNLTISAAENCTVAPKLNVRVQGAGQAWGIRAVPTSLQDGTYTPAGLTIGSETTPLDVDVAVSAVSGAPTLNPAVSNPIGAFRPIVLAITAGNDINLYGGNITVASVGNYQGTLFVPGESGYGELLIHTGTIKAENNGRNGSGRVSSFWVKWADGYTAMDENGEPLVMDEALWAQSATFLPNSEVELTGTVVITGEARVAETLTVTVSDTNALGKPIIKWFRVFDGKDPVELKSVTGNTFTLRDYERDSYIYCVVTSVGRKGELTSNRVGPITAALYPTFYICGTAVTADNALDVLQDGKVSYAADTGTLTLNNVTLAETGTQNAIISLTEENRALTIQLIGSNTLTAAEDKMAISVNGDLTFTNGSADDSTGGETGSKTGGTVVTLTASSVKPTKNYGTICAAGSVTVDERCQLSVSCETAAADYQHGTALTAGGDLTLSKASSLRASCEDKTTYRSTVLVTGSTTINEADVGVTGQLGEALRSEKNITLNGGTVKGSSYGAYVAYQVKYYRAAVSASGTFTVNDGLVESYSEAGYALMGSSAFVVNGGTVTTRLGESGQRNIFITGFGTPTVRGASMVYASKSGNEADKVEASLDVFAGKTYHYVQLLTSGFPTTMKVWKATGFDQRNVTLTVTINSDASTTNTAVLVFARYNQQGKLMELQQQDISFGVPKQTITNSFTSETIRDVYKVFVVKDTASWIPLFPVVEK